MPIFSRQRVAQAVTVESIVETILTTWSKDDLAFVKSGEYDFGMIGRRIRNDFGLWDPSNPLTQHWHLHEDSRNIVDGVDYSEDHPDAVSAEVVELVRARL